MAALQSGGGTEGGIMATGDPKTKWKGNGNGHSSQPETLTNAFDIELSYPGKLPENEILKTEPADIEAMWGEKSSGNHNRLYYGDNLPILSALRLDPRVNGQVKLIYIDPPFSTNSVFKSRSQKDAYHDLLVGAHYIEYMRQRLILLRELLSEDGSIYVHIDDKMAFHIKVILDEVFGRKNFRNCITRRKSNPKNYTRKTYGNISDYIFFYTKSDEYIWNRSIEMWTPEHAKKEYIYTEKETGRRFKKVPVHAPGVRNGETGKPWRGMNPPPGKHWQYPPQVLDEMDERGEIYWSSTGNPRRKIYLDNSEGIPVQDIWWDMRDAHNQNIKITGYPTEKNPDLISRIITASSNSGDLVLDCFSGSGTTISVASQLNRSWIGIDNSPEAIAVTLKRFAKGVEPMGDFVNKKKTTDHKQLPLILEPETTKTLINDFVLYATIPHSTEIADSVVQWNTYHHQT